MNQRTESHDTLPAPPAAPAPAPVNQELLGAFERVSQSFMAADLQTVAGSTLGYSMLLLAADLRDLRAAIANATRAESGAPAPVPQPLTPFTDAQVHRLWANASLRDAPSFEAFKRMVRLTESAHGITGGATGGSK